MDDARLSWAEERLMRSYDVRVAAARRRVDGAFGGHAADIAWQDDTLVMPEHLVHTWPAPSDTAMHRTNTTLGFRVVERMHEMEARVSTRRAAGVTRRDRGQYR